MLGKIVSKKSNEAEVAEELVDKYPEAVVSILRNWLRRTDKIWL
jgi:flagellar biosynthesis/type III secretory pathway M-ring protein FliF/YscJ